MSLDDRSPGRRRGALSFLATALLVWCSIAVAEDAGATLPPGRGILLPVQDRVGDAALVQLTEAALREELSASGDLAEGTELRAALRRLRIRDASSVTPDRLASLAASLGIEWFFLATLHEAVEGPTPQVTLSARLLQAGSPDLWWAGFEGATGRDRERWLGLGQIETLEELVRQAAQRLAARAAAERTAPGRIRLRHPRVGFLRQPIAVPSSLVRVAVVPLDSVADERPTFSAEVVTAALFAALDERGFKTLVPGLAREIRQAESQLLRGAVTRAEWEALSKIGGAAWVATGTVEAYSQGIGQEPDPWVAFSIRFLDPESGRIAWIDGKELTGWETGGAFDRRQLYSAGQMAFEMMRSLLGGMLSGSRRGNQEQGG